MYEIYEISFFSHSQSFFKIPIHIYALKRYRLAVLAHKTGRLKLARHALECALWVNPKHLPSLHKLPKIIGELNKRTEGNSCCVVASKPQFECALKACSWIALWKLFLEVSSSIMNGLPISREHEEFFEFNNSDDVVLTMSSCIRISLNSQDEREEVKTHEAGSNIADLNLVEDILTDGGDCTSPSTTIEVKNTVVSQSSEGSQGRARRSQRQESRRAAEASKEETLETRLLNPIIELMNMQDNTQVSLTDMWWEDPNGFVVQEAEEVEVSGYEDKQVSAK
jgi:hypothetical protein